MSCRKRVKSVHPSFCLSFHPSSHPSIFLFVYPSVPPSPSQEPQSSRALTPLHHLIIPSRTEGTTGHICAILGWLVRHCPYPLNLGSCVSRLVFLKIGPNLSIKLAQSFFVFFIMLFFAVSKIWFWVEDHHPFKLPPWGFGEYSGFSACLHSGWTFWTRIQPQRNFFLWRLMKEI